MDILPNSLSHRMTSKDVYQICCFEFVDNYWAKKFTQPKETQFGSYPGFDQVEAARRKRCNFDLKQPIERKSRSSCPTTAAVLGAIVPFIQLLIGLSRVRLTLRPDPLR
jgi:hypothetical protein